VSALRAVVAEDLALLRDGIVRLLDAHGFDVVAAVEDGVGLVELLVDARPDVAIVDIRLPPTLRDEGLLAAIEARRRVPGLPILILSQYVEQIYARELMADGRGGVGYLLKNRVSDVDAFVDAVRQVAAGGTVLDPIVVAKLLHSKQRVLPLERLSPREREVLAQLAQGRSNAAIGAALVITEKAVGKHTASIFTKLDLPVSEDDNRRVLAVLAYLNGAT
jgi:DNA-binding NarL/FixJ family response regulator